MLFTPSLSGGSTLAERRVRAGQPAHPVVPEQRQRAQWTFGTLDYLPPLRADVFSELPIATTTIRLTAVAGKYNISAFASVYTASC
jgi:hypothetical protein